MQSQRLVFGSLLCFATLAAAGGLKAEHERAPSTAGAVVLDVMTVRRRAEMVGPGVIPARVANVEATRTRSAVDIPLSRPPRLELDVARRSWPQGAGIPGSNGLDITGRLWQDFSLGGYGGARESYADAVLDRSKAHAELTRRDAIARATNAWVDARYGREMLALRKESKEAAEELLRIADARVRAGSAPPMEVALARAVLGAARAGVLSAEGQVIVADGDLRYAVGLGPDTALQPIGGLSETDDREIDEQRTIDLAQSHHPFVLRARAEADSNQQYAEVLAAAGRPFLGVGVSYTREGDNTRIVGGMLSIPLPFVNPNVLESSMVRSEAAVGRAQIKDIQAHVAREVRQAIHERYHAREVREELRTGAVLPGKEAVREMTRRYEAGAVELATVLAVRRELLVSQEGFLAAAVDVQRADIRLEHAAGGPAPRRASP